MKTATRDMLAKLIGMLGSDSDGECLNAARLLKRRMAQDGVTFGDLSNLIRDGVVYIEARAAPRRPYKSRGTYWATKKPRANATYYKMCDELGL